MTHTCWWRHCPPGGFWSAWVQPAAVLLVFHEIVVHVFGEHLPPLGVVVEPKHTSPVLHENPGIVPYMTVSWYGSLPDRPGAVLLPLTSFKSTSYGWVRITPS